MEWICCSNCRTCDVSISFFALSRLNKKIPKMLLEMADSHCMLVVDLHCKLMADSHYISPDQHNTFPFFLLSHVLLQWMERQNVTNVILRLN